MIQVGEDQNVFLQHGPISMTIKIWKNQQPSSEIGMVVAQSMIEQFEELKSYTSSLRKMRSFKLEKEQYPRVLNRMIRAVQNVPSLELNTLAAVAGAFSDEALEEAQRQGADRILVNNGGDIALKDFSGQGFTVGIPIKHLARPISLTIDILDSWKVHGICTSGCHGRSFTKGIADFVVVMAESSAQADACATFIGNETNIKDPNILRCMAEEIDEGTDIAGQLITMKVGQISKQKKMEALYNGILATEKLVKLGLIKGALVCVGEELAVFPDEMRNHFQYQSLESADRSV